LVPYVAFDTHKNRRVDTYDSVRVHEDFPPGEFGGGRLICQFCGVAMHARQGERYAPHFVHEAVCDRAGYESKPETPEHLAAKAYIRNLLQTAHPEESVEVEMPVASCKRIADVLLSFRDGWSIAHEVQLSPIAEPELIRRTQDYEQAGIDVMWWFGPTPPPVALAWAKRREQPLLALNVESASDGAPDGRSARFVRHSLTVTPIHLYSSARQQIEPDRILRELQDRWYPPRLRLLLTLLLWRDHPLTFGRLANGSGLSASQVGGAHGEVKKLVDLKYGWRRPRAGPRAEKTVCLTSSECARLAKLLAEPAGYGNPSGTVLGHLIERTPDNQRPLLDEARSRARLLSTTGLPSAQSPRGSGRQHLHSA